MTENGAPTPFADALTRLFSAAGSPTLKSVAAGVSKRGHAARVEVPGGLYARLGEWRSGKHLPREFDSVVSLSVAELLHRARRRGELPHGIPTQMDQWRILLDRSRETPSAPSCRELRCPYVGLSSFSAEDRDRFFGREHAITEICARVDDAADDDLSLVSVVGVSGSGKSSVLAAGVVPRLEDAGDAVVSMTPGAHPCATVGDLLGLGRGWSTDEVADSLSAAALGSESGRAVLVVDQLEELLTQSDALDRSRFSTLLGDLARGDAKAPDARVVVVVAVRADFLPHWSAVAPVREALSRHSYVLGPLSRDDLARAVTGPLATVGGSAEPGLVELVLDEFCGPDGQDYDVGLLPLFQHSLSTTWTHCSGSTLTFVAYRGSGGVDGAVRETAEEVWNGLTDEERTAARRVMTRLVTVGHGTRDTRVARSRAEVLDGLGPAGPRVLDRLIGSRVLVSRGEDVVITHEVVFTAWPRLRGWLDADRARHLDRQILEDESRRWDESGREGSHLRRGTRLDSAREVVAHEDAPTGLAREFVAASTRSDDRHRLFRRSSLATLACITVTALVAMSIAWWASERADGESEEARWSQVRSEANRTIDADTTMSARLTLAEARRRPSEQNDSRLFGTTGLPLAKQLLTGAGSILDLAPQPTGDLVAIAGADSGVQLWSGTAEGVMRPSAVLAAGPSSVTSLAWSPDGGTLVGAAEDGTVTLWRRSPGPDADDTSEWTAVRQLRSTAGRVVDAAFSPDGSRLATAGGDQSVRIWDPESGRERSRLDGHRAEIRAVTWSPDGRYLATGSLDDTVRMWDAATSGQVAEYAARCDGVQSLAFSPEGSILATGGDDSSAHLWSVGRDGALRSAGPMLSSHTGPVLSVAVSPDSRRLLVASSDGSATLWGISDPAAPTPLGRPLVGTASSIRTATFAADGREVLTASADGVVRQWFPPETVLAGHTGRVLTPALSGSRLLTAATDGSFAVRDLTDPMSPRVVTQSSSREFVDATAVALTADGDTAAVATENGGTHLVRVGPDRGIRPIATLSTGPADHVGFAPGRPLVHVAGDDGILRLWDVTDPSAPSRRGEARHGDGRTGITAVAWSPDGRHLVTGGPDHRLVVWDVSPDGTLTRVAVGEASMRSTVSALSWAAGRPVIAAGGLDGTVQMWSWEGSAFRMSSSVSEGRSVRSLTHTADGTHLVAAGDGTSLSIWDFARPDSPRREGDPIPLIRTNRWYAASSGDGRTVVAAGDKGAVQVVVRDRDLARARICRTAGPMDDDQWQGGVLGFAPFADICA